MSRNSPAHFVRIDVTNFIIALCLDCCCKIHPHTLSGLMSQNSSTSFIEIDVAKFIRPLCPFKNVLEVDTYVFCKNAGLPVSMFGSNHLILGRGQSAQMNFVTSIRIKYVDESRDINRIEILSTFQLVRSNLIFHEHIY